ncbi:SDR family NAD(P)-dependent oxidoreductase [Chloroflexota bacterium]
MCGILSRENTKNGLIPSDTKLKMEGEKMELEGKVSIITGGSTGLGKAMALEFAKAGADVVVCSRNRTNIETVSEEIKALGRRSLAIVTDVCIKEQVISMVNKVIDEFGRVDILVNNSGISRRASILDLAEDEWDIVIDTNLKGVFLCTQAVAKYMVEQKYGKIINITSTAALGGVEETLSSYVSSKFGVVGFTKASAREFGRYGINVNAIAPGRILTDNVYANRTPEQIQTWIEDSEKGCLLGRLGTPEDIAHLALFLASDNASFINAEIVACNGGRINLMGR